MLIVSLVLHYLELIKMWLGHKALCVNVRSWFAIAPATKK